MGLCSWLYVPDGVIVCRYGGGAAVVGETPYGPGDCQLEIVDGDAAGEFSSLRDCPVELWVIECGPGGGKGSIPSGIFFK